MHSTHQPRPLLCVILSLITSLQVCVESVVEFSGCPGGWKYDDESNTCKVSSLWPYRGWYTTVQECKTDSVHEEVMREFETEMLAKNRICQDIADVTWTHIYLKGKYKWSSNGALVPRDLITILTSDPKNYCTTANTWSYQFKAWQRVSSLYHTCVKHDVNSCKINNGNCTGVCEPTGVSTNKCQNQGVQSLGQNNDSTTSNPFEQVCETCSYKCRNTSETTAECHCKTGYSLVNETLCFSDRLCKVNNGGCDHTCVIIGPNQKVCTCYYGFYLQNGTDCIAINDPAKRGDVEKTSFRSSVPAKVLLAFIAILLGGVMIFFGTIYIRRYSLKKKGIGHVSTSDDSQENKDNGEHEQAGSGTMSKSSSMSSIVLDGVTLFDQGRLSVKSVASRV